MYKLAMLICAVAACAAMVSSGVAATHVVEIADVQQQILYGVDLGARFEHITEVSVRSVGVGGRGHYVCTAPAVDGWYDLDVVISFGAGQITFPTRYGEPYDVTAPALVSEGSWRPCEGVENCPAGWTAEPRGIVNGDWRYYCGPDEWDVAPISRMVITITADSVVATEGMPWGSMKSRYR